MKKITPELSHLRTCNLCNGRGVHIRVLLEVRVVPVPCGGQEVGEDNHRRQVAASYVANAPKGCVSPPYLIAVLPSVVNEHAGDNCERHKARPKSDDSEIPMQSIAPHSFEA